MCIILLSGGKRNKWAQLKQKHRWKKRNKPKKNDQVQDAHRVCTKKNTPRRSIGFQTKLHPPHRFNKRRRRALRFDSKSGVYPCINHLAWWYVCMYVLYFEFLLEILIVWCFGQWSMVLCGSSWSSSHWIWSWFGWVWLRI